MFSVSGKKIPRQTNFTPKFGKIGSLGRKKNVGISHEMTLFR